MEVSVYVAEGSSLDVLHQPTPSSPEEAIAFELNSLPGALIEIVLPDDIDPTPFIKTIMRCRPGRLIGVNVVGSDTWGPLYPLLRHHQLDDTTQDIILVIDPTVMSMWTDTLDRRLRASVESRLEDIGRIEAQTIGVHLWRLLEQLRESAEETGDLVILFTVDHRPDSGVGGIRPSNFWTDARVRSFIGDAGRYWCHQRYLVTYSCYGKSRMACPHVTVIKDEAEGIVGRKLSWRGAI
jgi:hypothetical protein